MPSKTVKPAPKPAPAKVPLHKKVWEKAYKQKNSWIRQGLKAGGSALGSVIGGPVGSMLGTKAGDWIANLVGAGAYKQSEIKYNTSFARLPEASVLHSATPAMHVIGSNIRVAHREYIGEVISSSTANTFKVEKYAINPALRSTFPWLSPIAQQYEAYKMHGIIFEFRSNSGNALNSTNTALGSVVMGASYRSSSITPTNKQQIFNYEWANETVPSKDMIMGIECDPSSLAYKQYFNRGNDAIPEDDSINMYDMANLYVATSGCQGTSVVLGSLYCSYDVELIHSIDSADIGQWLHQARFGAPNRTITSTNAGASPFLGAVAIKDGIGITILTSDTVSFPLGTVGKYQISYACVGSSESVGNWTFTYTNCSAINVYNDGTQSTRFNTGTNTIAIFDSNIEITDPTKVATVKAVNTALPSNWTANDLTIVQLANTVF